MYRPDDLVVEILSRVPLDSLSRLRWTSKGWNALIKDNILPKKPSMIIMLIDCRVYLVSVDLNQIHNNKVTIISQFVLKDPFSYNSLEEVDIRQVFHCDGLLLCFTKDNRLVVWNPFSRETRWIQPRDSYKKCDFFALCKSPCNMYKILRVDQHGYIGPTLTEFEIYDFTFNSWRVIGNTRDWYIQRIQSCGMTVKGNTYWLALSPEDHFKRDFLLSFNFSTEKFGRASLPGDVLSQNAMALSMTRDEQQLCLLACRRDEYFHNIYGMDVWIANKIESNGAASWSKLLSVDLANIHLPFCLCNGMNFLVDQENKVLVCRGKPGVSNNFLNIVGEDKCIPVDHAKAKCSLVLSYVPTLVEIQQGLAVHSPDVPAPPNVIAEMWRTKLDTEETKK